jgi:hypothetical protein
MKRDGKAIVPKTEGGAFEIPAAEFRDREQLIKRLFEVQEELIAELERVQAQSQPSHLQGLESGLAVVATNAWKARAKMMDGDTGEPRDDMRRVYRHIETIFDAFHQMGLRVKDHTGEEFDYGLPLTVITTQPTPGLARERVIETIKPTIYWKDTIIQTGEVVIATPIPSEPL